MKTVVFRIELALVAFMLMASSFGGDVASLLQVPLKRIGTLVPRSAPDPKDDQWMIGCEVLDRDYACFDNYKSHLAKLGIRTIRLQCGWAKCEQVRGEYDFDWLDRQVDFALSHGLNVVLETDYGNPLYKGGGGRDLAAGFPYSEEGLAAWDRWVDALTRHFAGRVRDWAMWNESPVWIDLLTGEVYDYPESHVLKRSGGVTLIDLPIYDSPCLLTGRAAVEIDFGMR